MKSFEAKTLINARKSTVWDIITDGGNYTVWDSGITHISGGLRNGATIRVRTRNGGNRTFRLRVRQIPGEAMIWTGRLALGLDNGVCTFTVTSHGEKTLLHVRQDLAGPLLGLLWKTQTDIEPAFAGYVDAVKKRAELLSRHEARMDPRFTRPTMERVGRKRPRPIGCPRHSAMGENSASPRPASAPTAACAAGPAKILPVDRPHDLMIAAPWPALDIL